MQPGASFAVSLLFCELYFTDPNARRFSVTFDSKQILLSNFSVVQAAGLSSDGLPNFSLFYRGSIWVVLGNALSVWA